MSGEENFLARWSRRKAEDKAAGKAEPPPAKTAEAPAEEKSPEPATGETAGKAEEPVDLSKLPSLESLGKDSDYSMFMRKGVPEDLRLKAIRRMWATDPSIAGPDLLDMHAWDYTGTDGLKPLVAPAIEAVAAAAKELVERQRASKAEAAQPSGESPAAETAENPPPPEAPEKGRG